MNTRRRLKGTVIRAKSQKTVIVEIPRSYRHPIYGKVIHSSDHMMVHDELDCKLGDFVQIVETKPISRRKRWAVESILSRLEETDAPPEVAGEELEATEVEE